MKNILILKTLPIVLDFNIIGLDGTPANQTLVFGFLVFHVWFLRKRFYMDINDIFEGFLEKQKKPKKVNRDKCMVFQKFKEDYLDGFFKEGEIIKVIPVLNQKWHYAYIKVYLSDMVFEKNRFDGLLKLISACDAFKILMSSKNNVVFYFQFNVFE